MEARKRVPVGKKLRLQVLERDSRACRYCGKTITESTVFVDHVLPVARGGANSYSNLVAACFNCNASKGAHGAAWLIEQAPEAIRAWWRDFLTRPPQLQCSVRKSARLSMSETQESLNPVRAVRYALSLTQKQMAEKMGCSFATERRCEYENRLPQNVAVQKNLQRLAKQAGVTLEAEAATST